MKEILVRERISKTNNRCLYKIKIDLDKKLQECSKCHIIKNFDEFDIDKRRKQYGSVHHQCKDCFIKLHPIAETYICSNCNIKKPLWQFHKNKNRKNGHDFYCKPCRMSFVKYHYDPEQNRKLRQNYKDQWAKFFIETYGNNPKCGVCDKNLKFFDNNKQSSVHWDHQHGKTNQYRGPGDWLVCRPCNEENIKEWLKFDYGILCHNCNIMIPTNCRKEWIYKIIKYTFGEEYDLIKLENQME